MLNPHEELLATANALAAYPNDVTVLCYEAATWWREYIRDRLVASGYFDSETDARNAADIPNHAEIPAQLQCFYWAMVRAIAPHSGEHFLALDSRLPDSLISEIAKLYKLYDYIDCTGADMEIDFYGKKIKVRRDGASCYERFPGTFTRDGKPAPFYKWLADKNTKDARKK